MNEPLVSVIVPVYNTARYLPACLASLRSQRYAALELLLIDDGSTDGSAALCDAAAAADPRVRVLHQKNAGLAAARNAGLARARGEYLTFVDSDDLLHRDAIARLLAACESTGARLAIGDHCRVPVDCPLSFCTQPLAEAPVHCITGREANFRLYELPHWTRMITAWGKLYHHSLFAEEHFPLVSLHEDEALLYKLLYILPKIALCDAPLYAYRTTPGSLMAQPLTEARLGIFPILAERAQFYAAHGEMALYAKTQRRAFAIATRYRVAAHRQAPGSALEAAVLRTQRTAYCAVLRTRPLPLHALKYTLMRYTPQLALRLFP